MPLSHDELMDTVLVGSEDGNTVWIMSKSQIQANQVTKQDIAFVRGSIHEDVYELLHASFMLYHALTNSMLGLNRLLAHADMHKHEGLAKFAQELQDPILLAQRCALVGPDKVNKERGQELAAKRKGE